MRTLKLASVAIGVLSLCAMPARAQYVGGSWCANYGNQGGGTNCGFYSYDQCMAAISGNGGMCSRNQWSSGSSDRDSRRRSR
jgi:Protein of unknown function (DUF3551)